MLLQRRIVPETGCTKNSTHQSEWWGEEGGGWREEGEEGDLVGRGEGEKKMKLVGVSFVFFVLLSHSLSVQL